MARSAGRAAAWRGPRAEPARVHRCGRPQGRAAGEGRADLRRRAAGRHPRLRDRARQADRLDVRRGAKRRSRSSRRSTPTCPTLGRLTGRGNTANVEVVLAGEARLHRGLRHGQRHLRVAGRPRAAADRHTLRAARRGFRPHGRCDPADRADRAARRSGRRRLRATRRRRFPISTRRVAKIPASQRPRVYYGRGPQGLNTGLAGSINIESIEQLGAVNVAAELGKGGLVQVSIEQVLRWNPDVVITIDPNFYAAARSHPAVGQPARRSRRGASTCRPACRTAGSIFRPRSTA